MSERVKKGDELVLSILNGAVNDKITRAEVLAKASGSVDIPYELRSKAREQCAELGREILGDIKGHADLTKLR